ncbi:MAG: sensor domain-containing diguanylate cyclase [Actinomycetota bacterium]|nr:sensor domain-containing diguanylate cyclase [Actinomycetota bacterium]
MRLDPMEYQMLVEGSPHMIWRCGAGGARDYFSRVWLEFTGRKIEQELGDGWREAIHPEDIAVCVKAYADALDQCGPYEAGYRLRRHDGEWRWVSDKGAPFSDKGGRFAGLIGSCADVHEQARTDHLKDLALADGLTGLYRRRYFEERLDDEIRRARRYHADLSLIKLDVDDFKSLNTRFGRPAADKVLKALAHIVRENTRSHDIACRFGGDEFCIALPYAKVADAEVTAVRIGELAQKGVITFDRQSIEFSVSFSVVALTDEINAGKLISKADKGLFEAEHGRGRAA